MYPLERSLPHRAARGLYAHCLGLVAAAAALCASTAAAQPLTADDCGAAAGAALLLTGESGECAAAPILDTEITIAVTGIIARARVTQKFYNPGDDWVEGVYIFPLPDGAAVDHLRMFVGDRIIEGQIRERESARADYEAAKRSGVRASLVEQQRPNIFTTSVANIGPEETVEIVLELQDVVRYDSGEFRLRFPTVVAPRHLAGAADAGPTPGALAADGGAADGDPIAFLTQAVARASEPINFFSMEVEVDAGFALRALYSPTHGIETADLSGGVQLVRLRDSIDPADRDFVLVWAPRLGEQPRATLFSEELGGDTYALLMLVPPAEDLQSTQHLSREVVLVIDTSGSMIGDSLDQAKLALQMALDQLRPDDWFNVIEFNTEAQRLFPASVATTAAAAATARSFVDGLQADGGTNIAAALELALDPPAAPVDLRQVIFITDGAVGNEVELFTYIEQHIGDSRLFTVGIGAAPNAHFMRKAAEFGRGSFTFVGRPEDVSAAMDTLFAKLERPVLTDLRIDWGVDSEADAWPAPVPDLYAGEPLVVAARLEALPDQVTVSGTRSGAGWSTALDTRQDGETPGDAESGVGKLWARRKVEGLMDGLALGAERTAVRSAVLEIGLEHHLVTPFTSLIAVDVSPSAPSGGAPTRLVPLNRPAGAAGLLPRTATPSLLHAFAAVALLLVGLALRPRDESDRRED